MASKRPLTLIAALLAASLLADSAEAQRRGSSRGGGSSGRPSVSRSSGSSGSSRSVSSRSSSSRSSSRSTPSRSTSSRPSTSSRSYSTRSVPSTTRSTSSVSRPSTSVSRPSSSGSSYRSSSSSSSSRTPIVVRSEPRTSGGTSTRDASTTRSTPTGSIGGTLGSRGEPSSIWRARDASPAPPASEAIQDRRVIDVTGAGQAPRVRFPRPSNVAGQTRSPSRTVGAPRDLSRELRSGTSREQLHDMRRSRVGAGTPIFRSQSVTREDILSRYRSTAASDSGLMRSSEDTDPRVLRRVTAELPDLSDARRGRTDARPTRTPERQSSVDRVTAAREAQQARDAARIAALRDQKNAQNAERIARLRDDKNAQNAERLRAVREADNERRAERLAKVRDNYLGSIADARSDGGDGGGYHDDGDDHYHDDDDHHHHHFYDVYWGYYGGWCGSWWGWNYWWGPSWCWSWWWHDYWYYGGYWYRGHCPSWYWYGPFLPASVSVIYQTGGYEDQEVIYVDDDPEIIYVEQPAPEGEAIVVGGEAAGPGVVPQPAGAGEDALNRAADYYLTLGDRAFREGRYGDAVHFYAKAVEFAPEEGILFLILSDALFATGDYHYAAYALRKAFELDPQIVQNVVDKHSFYADPAEFDRQLAVLELYLEDHFLDDDARLVLAANYLFGGRPAVAVDLLESSFSADVRGTPAGQIVLEAARAVQYGEQR